MTGNLPAMSSTIDANGATHSGQTGRFTGRWRTESDASQVLPQPAAKHQRIEPGARVEVYSRPYDTRVVGTLQTEVYSGTFMAGTLERDDDGSRYRSEGFWTRLD